QGRGAAEERAAAGPFARAGAPRGDVAFHGTSGDEHAVLARRVGRAAMKEAVMRKRWQGTIGMALLLGAAMFSAPVQAGDFFSNLFGGFARPAPSRPQMIIPFGDEEPQQVERPRVASGGGQAWCVRGCDGRYFPITGPDAQSKAASCSSFCPASETNVVYGS